MDTADDLTRAMRRAPAPRIETRFARAATRLAIRVMPIPKVAGVSVETRVINGVPVRVYRPGHIARTGRRSPALMWIHGGGLVIGHPRQDDLICKETAARLGCVVFSPDYRLAPRHPFPAAHDDCLSVWSSVLSSADSWGIDPDRVALGGQSAGAGLAASVTLRLRDIQASQPRALWLFSPMLDDRTAIRRELDSEAHPVWTNVRNRFGWTAYLPGGIGSDNVSPYAAPGRASDLRELPTTWIGIGDVDLFFAEACDFAEKLRDASVPVAIRTVPQGFHGFETLAPNVKTVQEYLSDARTWLAQQLAI